MKKYFLLICLVFFCFIISGREKMKEHSINSTSIDSKEKFVNTFQEKESIFGFDNDPWVDSIISKMTLEEKAGQVVFPYVYGKFYSDESSEFGRLKHLIEDLHVGGFIFFQSEIYEQAMLTNKLQQLSEIPLLFSADYERGLYPSAISSKTTNFPYNMAIGAADDSLLTFKMGEIIAKESRAIGIHQDYAPVVDVNNNPYNPIINVRSYGEDINLVTRLSNAFIKGLQENGVIATSKHFPGHGNTDVDSHRDLPIIKGTKSELEKLELYPFKSNIENNVLSIMIAHLGVPAFEPNEKLPSTLSKNIITNLLKDEMGYKGLVVTDAMNMHAITNYYSTAEATVMSLNAGSDAILMPEDEDEAVNAIIDAVKLGKLSEKRLDYAVRKILSAKKWLGLDKNVLVDVEKISLKVATEENINVANKLAQKSITIVKDELSLLPLQNNLAKKTIHISVLDEQYSYPANYFNSLLQNRIYNCEYFILPSNSIKNEYDIVFNKIKDYDNVILSVYLKVRAYKGSVGLTNDQKNFINNLLNERKDLILLAHGNPYLLMEFPNVSTYVCNYGDSEVSETALAQALFSENNIGGKLPISIPKTNYKFGTSNSIKKSALANLSNPFSISEEKKFGKVDNLINKAIEDSVFPGGVLLIAKDGNIIHQKAFGRFTYDWNSNEVDINTIYDLASVSKVIATTTAAMICYDRNLFSFDDKVVKYFPEFQSNGKDKITIRNLLLHNSGLPAFKRYYEMNYDKEKILEDIYKTKLEYETGTKTIYSDLGIIVLGKIIEKVSGKTLDQFCYDEIFAPLGMSNTFYNPQEIFKERIAPTENDTSFRKRLLIGEVHDENAYILGGVAGHAGLFSTANDLAKILQMLLQKGYYQGKQYIKKETVELFTKRQSNESSRALGWDTKSEQGSSAGTLFSDLSYGHTGFTGPSVWIDPTKNLFVVFLCNRVYPTRENTKIGEFRPKLHNEIMRAID